MSRPFITDDCLREVANKIRQLLDTEDGQAGGWYHSDTYRPESASEAIAILRCLPEKPRSLDFWRFTKVVMPASLRLSWSMKSLKLFLLPVLDSLEFGWQVIRYALIFVSAFFRQRASLAREIIAVPRVVAANRNSRCRG